MGKIYSTQKIEIVISYEETYKPTETADSYQIKYKKPNGESGYWVATIDANANTISYIGANTSSYGVSGTWYFWPVAIIAWKSPEIGEPIEITIYEEGK